MAGKIDVSACERLITAATAHCTAPAPHGPAPPALPPPPDWEALSTSLAALSLSFSYGAIVLAVIIGALALGWGYLVYVWARAEAREAAEKLMNEWLSTEAPKLIREGAALLHFDKDNQSTATDSGKAADDIGKEAG